MEIIVHPIVPMCALCKDISSLIMYMLINDQVLRFPHPAFHRTPTRSLAVEMASAASPTIPIPSSSSSPNIPLDDGSRVRFADGIGIAATEDRRSLSSSESTVLDRREELVEACAEEALLGIFSE